MAEDVEHLKVLLEDARRGCAILVTERVRILSALGLLTEEEKWDEADILTRIKELRIREKLPAQDTDREMWLLTPLGSLGRTQIQVEQYEELRKFAIKLAFRVQTLSKGKE